MNKKNGTKVCFIATAIALLAVFVAAPAGAGDLNWKLRGDYAYNVAATCATAACGPDLEGKYNCQAESTRGFDPATLALREPGKQKSYSYNVQGVADFDGHGNFTFKGEALVIRTSLGTSQLDIPANQADLECHGTYIVGSKDSELFVDITSTNCTSKITSGQFGLMGVTQELSGPVTVRGRLDTFTGSSIVIISNTLPYIEETELTAPLPLKGMNEQRICNNMGSIVKLSPRRNWFSK
jgi:hypothetical protein